MENNRIEYKRELTDGLEKEVVAFLNYHDGGLIYIGIDAAGDVYGVPDCDAVQLAIKDRLKNNIQSSCLGLFDVIHETRDGKNIIKLIIASGSEKPYYLRRFGMSEKGCFIRIGSASEPMTVRMIEELFARRTRNSIARSRSPRQDLGFEQLKIYYQEAGLTLGDKFAANLELLTDDGAYNYAAYLLADENGNSVQVAKYAGSDRVDLLESKEYGFCCLVKTCKQVIDRLEGLENRVINKITPRERVSRPFWNPVALREALINAIIHNDYSTELVPKFELFADRLEITSAGVIHPGKEQDDFFAGYSMPRNKTLMRVFKDLEMVEYLGSGMPRILKAYPREAYTFSSHFIRTAFPISLEALELEHEVTEETVEKNYRKELQEKTVDTKLLESRLESRLESALAARVILRLASGNAGKTALAEHLGHKSVSGELHKQIKRLLENALIEMTIPDKPNSRLQKYRLTTKGKALLATRESSHKTPRNDRKPIT